MSDVSAVSPDVSSSSGYASMEADLASLDTATDEGTQEGAEDTPDTGEPASSERAPEETEAGDDGEEAEPDETETPVGEEETAPVEAKHEQTDPDLPEGVTVRDKNGKKEWVFRESRGREIYGAYKAAQAAEDVFGEALTPEVAKSRQDAYVAQEMMIADFMSGEPRFLDQLAQWSRLAQENGEVSHNPLRQLAIALPDVLTQIGDRETLDALTQPLLRRELDSLYELAIQTKNQNLLLSLQHVDNAKFKTYKKEAELANPDPLAKREQEVKTREEKLAQRDRIEAQRAFDKWQNDTGTAIKSAVDAELATALNPVEAAYAKFPTEFEGVKTVLHKEFQQKLKDDAAWQARLKRDTQRAANAASPAIRDAVKAELEAAYRAKAKWFFNPTSNPRVKQILSERAIAMKDRSAATHQRQQVAAARREPGSMGTPVPQRVSEQPNGHGSSAWADAIEKALS